MNSGMKIETETRISATSEVNATLKTQLSNIGGHLIADLDGRKCLIDTGSPVTFGTGKSLRIGNETFPTLDNFLGVTVESIAESVGHPLNLLIGMDVLSRFVVTLSVAAGEIAFRNEFLPEGELVPVNNWFGVPTIPIAVKGEVCNVVFDTGAPISYLEERFARDFEFVEKRVDFLPLNGTFEVDVYKVPVMIGSMESTFEVGAMNGVLAATLEAGDMSGIIGTEILRYADVTLSMAQNALALSNRGWA